MSAADIIIPLGCESCSDNDELKLLLRSIERNGRNVGTIWLVTDCAPSWLVPEDGLVVLPHPDTYRHNKDANLFEKIRKAMRVSVSADVVWTCDDCAVLQECDFSALPPFYNLSGRKKFKGRRKWYRRMRSTMDELRLTVWHYDTHCPQRWNRVAALRAIEATPYARPEGRCINTAVMGRLYGTELPAGAVEQCVVKETAQTKDDEVRLDRLFVGYNDDGFLGAGLRERLFGLFPEKSRWEK